MNKYNKCIFTALAGMVFYSMLITSCVDETNFGDDFLEKAPGGTVTSDTVFASAEYTKQFLTTLYSMQYYGLPYRNTSGDTYPCESSNIYVGKVDALTDCYTFTYLSGGIVSNYYLGGHTSNYSKRSDKWSYLLNRVWEAVRYSWLLIENVNTVPDLSAEDAVSYTAQAKCIIASRYFDTFRHYGGIPIIEKAFSGTDASYNMPRGSVEETVDFMVGLLDEAAEVLPWSLENPSTDAGRWTKAAAMAMKCRILQFAASPIFNDDEPYYAGATDNDAIWYGSYRADLWQEYLKACEDFFTKLNANGGYYLVTANGTRIEDYRLAYRSGYALQASPEVLLSTRQFAYDAYKSGYYSWHTWGDALGSIHRGYSPTQEYVEMFPWADGTPFNWDETEAEGKLDEIFCTGSVKGNDLMLTRDPRLYEEVIVNGQPVSLDWTSGNMSGQSFESWVGGTNAGSGSKNQTGSFATGYAPIKFLMGNDMLRKYTMWPALRLSDVYLMYAEALCQTGNLSKAIEQVDKVRTRVGLKGLVACNPDKNLTSDKDALIEEILRERACELGMEDTRFFDLVRYKKGDVFAKHLHGLRMYRLDDDGNRVETQWYGAGQIGDFPSKYDYEKFEISNPTRYWWTNGFDPKWYLSPFPLTEVNKNYGLVQNPGW